MQIISRKHKESVTIRFGDKRITVEIGEIKLNKVQLRISAPDEVIVERTEKPKGGDKK